MLHSRLRKLREMASQGDWTFGSEEMALWRKEYTPMAASVDKAILFARATVDKQHHLWPVAVFNTVPLARQYAGILKMAYAIGDQAVIKSLDPSAVLGADGLAVPGTKWSVKVVPYAPTPSATADDVPEEVSQPS